jgi:phosphotransferase system enzyme I (PtsI)
MSIHLTGVGGAPGIVLGRAARYIAVREQPAGSTDESADVALARFAAALEAAAERLRALAERQRLAGHEQEAGIFEFQALLVEDSVLSDGVTSLVRDESQPLDTALARTTAQMRAALAQLDDPYLRERAADVGAIEIEIVRALYGGGPSLADLPAGTIVIAPDLTPAETVELPPGIAGFATAFGGPTGHTAILARSRGIPAIVGLGEAALAIEDGTEVILDGDASVLIAGPAPDERAEYQQRLIDQEAVRDRQKTLVGQPGRLADGHPVALWANIGRPQEAALALEHGAEGIGLFRTEFLFLDRNQAPGEDEQYAAYRATLETMAGRTVVIRTLDIGGDKPLPYLDLPPEANPFLGARALRLCMRRPDLFRIQLRALLRAALHGDLWIMLPMVATPEDLAWGRAEVRAAARSLEAAGVDHHAEAPLGIMIETPAAAVTADLLARQAAFFSIGSNDLTQYTMAVDRGLTDLAARYPHDSIAVLRLIADVAEAAQRAGIPVGVCGELAGVPAIAPLLAGMGIHELSMAPASIPAVKECLLGITLAEAQEAARQAAQR